MASREAVGKALALFGATFPRDITPELVAVWLEVFGDVDDETLGRATRKALATCRYFPVPAEVRELCGANRPAFLDTEKIVGQIRGLSDYHPSRGTTPPSVEQVRATFGEAIGQAYGFVGGGRRLLSGNDTTASIALREFEKELASAVEVLGIPPAPMLALPRADTSGPVLFDDQPRIGGGFRRLGSGS